MKALRLKLYQETACYKKPHALKVSETYPLPPFATVKGMLHAVMGATSLIDMKLCIQGTHTGMINDYQTYYFFKSDTTPEFALTAAGLPGVKGEFNQITTMPIYRHLLYHVQLVIFVQAEETVLEQICESILASSAFISLGRHEDLVRVDGCDIVELEETDSCELTHSAFVPLPIASESDIYGMPYKLNWVYRIVKGVRVWDKIAVSFAEKDQTIVETEEFPLYIDDENHAVFFHH
ncbi:type I-B CRISPR-associated protein Cas5b [Domibacillus indicus]|uniref:type I-B CRISPR-associated protein Cas5b n=1 Tax=Domibacillus indicus TaxID=1437523 RepID=UPI000617DBBE|nr:type I-B CRISPR-associated protein Cas5b [Domibacillus indicus]